MAETASHGMDRLSVTCQMSGSIQTCTGLQDRTLLFHLMGTQQLYEAHHPGEAMGQEILLTKDFPKDSTPFL